MTDKKQTFGICTHAFKNLHPRRYCIPEYLQEATNLIFNIFHEINNSQPLKGEVKWERGSI